MANYIHSTLSPSFSQNGESGTMKKISFSIGSEENTDGNIVYSVFDLPQENIEKMVRESSNQKNKNGQDKK